MGSEWRLATRLRDQGARFEVIGSAALRADDAADLDVVVPPQEDHLDRFVSAVAAIGGWSLLSTSLPTSAALHRAGSWHFGTPDGPLDAFVGKAAG